MTKKSDIIDLKFIESYDISDYEVLTESGWEDITSIHKTVEYDVWEIVFSNGQVIHCADTHIFIDEDGQEVFAQDSVGINIRCQEGVTRVLSVTPLGYTEHMFDVTVDSPEHTYYTNGILSHNSITTSAFILHYMLFNANKLVAVLAHKAEGSKEILTKLQMMYEHLPIWLQQGVTDWNKGSFQLENGSRVIGSTTTSSAIRGKSVNLLALDEYAFVPKNIADDFMESVYPTISSGKSSKIIITSTPFGLNHFYKLWQDSVNGHNEYVRLNVPWYRVPGRDEKWKEETIRNIGEEAFAQEFDIQFLGSAGTLIDPAVLKTLVYQKPECETPQLKIYHPPAKYHGYIITVDCSEGLGQDYNCITVFDVTEMPYQQCAVYRDNKIDPHLMPDVIIDLSKKYNDAMTLCELNSTGILVTSILWSELEFENLLWCSHQGSKGQVLGAYKGRAQMGLKTSALTKRIGCQVMKSLIENRQLIINDYNTIQELSSFARDGSTYRAQDGNHDDTVSCLFLFSWITKQDGFSAIVESIYQQVDAYNLRSKLHNDAIESITTLTPMPRVENGVDEANYLERSKQFHNPDPLKFLLGGGE